VELLIPGDWDLDDLADDIIILEKGTKITKGALQRLGIVHSHMDRYGVRVYEWDNTEIYGLTFKGDVGTIVVSYAAGRRLEDDVFDALKRNIVWLQYRRGL